MSHPADNLRAELEALKQAEAHYHKDAWNKRLISAADVLRAEIQSADCTPSTRDQFLDELRAVTREIEQRVQANHYQRLLVLFDVGLMILDGGAADDQTDAASDAAASSQPVTERVRESLQLTEGYFERQLQ